MDTAASSSNVDLEVQLHKEDKEKFYRVFTLFDKNNDGTISTDEIRSILLYMGENPTENQVI